MYSIKPYTFEKARDLGVIVRPSKRFQKKIDVFDEWGRYLTSAGDINYADYPTFLEWEKCGKIPVGTAEERRRQYRIRHHRERKNFGSAAWAAWNFLW